MTTLVRCSDRDEWLNERKKRLGSSDAPAAIGVSPFKSQRALYHEKAGDVEPDDLSDNEVIYWGNVLESPIRKRVSEMLRQEIPHEEFTIGVSDSHPFMAATLDGTLTANHFVRDLFEEHGLNPPQAGTLGNLQIKTTSAWNVQNWQEDAPLEYQVQTQSEIFVYDMNWGVIAVLIGGQTLKMFPFLRHENFCKGLTSQLAEFWRRVQENDPPDADGSDSTAETLKKMHPKDDGEVVTLPYEAVLWDGEREQLKGEIKEKTKVVKELDNKIKAAIGSASIGQLPGGEFEYSYQLQKRKGYTVDPTEFRQLRRKKVS